MLNIYGSPLSPPTNKVRFVANYLNIPYEFHLIHLPSGEHRQSAYLAVNPFGKIPAIDDGGFKLGESNAIIRYLSDKLQANLYPSALTKRAIVDEWIDYTTQHVAIPAAKIMFNTYFYQFARTEKDERSLQDGYRFLEQNLPVIEKQLTQTQYLTGEIISLADMVLLSALDAAELSKVELTAYPRLNVWRTELMKEAFYQKCYPSYTAIFNEVMSKRNTQPTT